MDIRLRLLSFMLAVVSVSVAQMKYTLKRLSRRMGRTDGDADDENATDNSPQPVRHRVILLVIGCCR